MAWSQEECQNSHLAGGLAASSPPPLPGALSGACNPPSAPACCSAGAAAPGAVTGSSAAGVRSTPHCTSSSGMITSTRMGQAASLDDSAAASSGVPARGKGALRREGPLGSLQSSAQPSPRAARAGRCQALQRHASPTLHQPCSPGPAAGAPRSAARWSASGSANRRCASHGRRFAMTAKKKENTTTKPSREQPMATIGTALGPVSTLVVTHTGAAEPSAVAPGAGAPA